MNYIPDNWVVLKINVPDIPPAYKVLAGWSGGYLDSDSWRMNSGITRVERPGDGWNLFYGASGSCYECHEKHYGLRLNISGIYEQLVSRFGDGVELMPSDTDWIAIDYDNI